MGSEMCIRDRPKIADYPFTTLHPNLGVVRIDAREFVLADIPGLIEGAHEGVGIGDRFLGHIERCATNLHLVDGTADDVAESYRIVRGELDAYANGLEEKPELVALTKVDALSDDEIKTKTKELEAACNSKVLPLSAPTRKGVDDVLRGLMDAITEKRDAERAANEPESEGWSPV